MRIAIMALPLILVPHLAQAAGWTTVDNARFGFVVDVPPSFRRSPAPENGDGLHFTSPDGRSEIAAYGHWIDASAGLRGDERQEAAFAVKDGVTLTFQQVTARSYTLSGLKGDRILYIHATATCGGGAAAIVRVDYPAADRQRMDPSIARLARTLRGSGAC